MNTPSPVASTKGDPATRIATGVVLLVAAAMALGLIRLFGEQFRIGKLIGVVVAGGGIGLLFLVWGLLQVVAEAWRRGQVRQVVVIIGTIVVLVVGSVAAVYRPKGSSPPGDDFIALIGQKRSEAAVARMISRLGRFREHTVGLTKMKELKWEQHRVTMKLDDDKLILVRLGGLARGELYPGPLPFGLLPTDSREAILAKLGPHSHGTFTESLTYKYPERGAEIFFYYDEIHSIELFPPSKGEAGEGNGSP